MKFQAELDLVSVLKEAIKNTYKNDSIKILQEVSLGYGVADIVISDLKKSKKRRNANDVILNPFDINIYNIILTEKETSLKSILDTTKSSTKSVSDALNKLLKRRYVKENDGQFYINRGYELPFKNNFAIEAKLKDWKRALNQAYRYRWFAEYSYVVLDSYYSKAALKNLSVFAKYNIGLATISTEGILIRHYKPKRQKPFDPKMQILLSEKINNSYMPDR